MTCLWKRRLRNGVMELVAAAFRIIEAEYCQQRSRWRYKNSDPSQTDLGDLFVDAYPFVEDRDVRVEFDEAGEADDELVHDLFAAAESEDAFALVELGQRYKTR